MDLSKEALFDLISEVVGKDVSPLVEQIYKKENVSEFKLAEKLGITVNQVRSQLYRLQERNLVLFTRKKDKKKGWYVYFWTLDLKEAKSLFLRRRRQQLEDMQKQLLLEQNGALFICKNLCTRMTFEQALEFQFKCPECGEILNQESTGKNVEQLRRTIERIKEEIELYSRVEPAEEEEAKAKPKAAKKIVKKKAVKKSYVKRKAAKTKRAKKHARKLARRAAKKGILRKLFFTKAKKKRR